MGLLDGLYPSSALRSALERRQEVAAFLSLARLTPTAGAAAGGAGGRDRGTPGAAFASAMQVDRQRQRERRDSHGSALASISGSSHGSASLTSTLSSGAGGADLAGLALQVMQLVRVVERCDLTSRGDRAHGRMQLFLPRGLKGSPVRKAVMEAFRMLACQERANVATAAGSLGIEGVV